MHILVADDDAGSRELLAELLRHSGHTVTPVLDGHAALAAVAKENFEVVLMDDEMPGMSGPEATRAIRQAAAAAGQKRPIIVGISGNSTIEDEQRCLAAGMDAFFAKPVRAAELFSLLAMLARRHETPAAQANPASGPPPENLAESIRRATGGNEKIAHSLVKTFLHDAPEKLSALRNAISRRDAETVGSVAHSLKGSLALIGANKAAGTARNLQAMGRLGTLNGAAAEFRILDEEFRQVQRKLLELQPKAKPAAKQAAKPKAGPKSKSRPKQKTTSKKKSKSLRKR